MLFARALIGQRSSRPTQVQQRQVNAARLSHVRPTASCFNARPLLTAMRRTDSPSEAPPHRPLPQDAAAGAAAWWRGAAPRSQAVTPLESNFLHQRIVKTPLEAYSGDLGGAEHCLEETSTFYRIPPAVTWRDLPSPPSLPSRALAPRPPYSAGRPQRVLQRSPVLPGLRRRVGTDLTLPMRKLELGLT